MMLSTCIFSITPARCLATVFSPMPNSPAICLECLPATNKSSTSRWRAESVSKRAANSAERAVWCCRLASRSMASSNARQQRPAVERLFQEIQRPGAHGLHGHGDVGAAGDHNDGHSLAPGGKRLLQPQSAQPRHPHVEHHALRCAGRIVETVEKRLGREVRLDVETHAANHQA